MRIIVARIVFKWMRIKSPGPRLEKEDKEDIAPREVETEDPAIEIDYP